MLKNDSYYTGEAAPLKPQRSVKVISATDLFRIEKRIVGKEEERTLKTLLHEQRQQLHQQSVRRVSHWSQTMTGLRQSRQNARKQEQDREEERKKAIDEGFRKEAEQHRLDACQRAKRMQYLQSDEVKAFHSHISTLQVCEEREMQMKIKKERKHAEIVADEAMVASSLEKCRDLEKEEADMQLLQRLAKVQLAQIQIEQAKHRRLQAYEEKKGDLEYGQYLAMQDKIYNQEQKELSQRKRLDELDRKRVLDEMRQEAINKKIWDAHEAKEEDRITQAWAKHQERKAEIKGQIEEEWKQRSLRIRTEIGETIHKQAVDATVKEREIRDEQERKSNQKARAEAEAKELKKKRSHKELKDFYEQHEAQKKADKEKEIKESKEALARFKKEAVAWELEQAKKKEKVKYVEGEQTSYNRAQSLAREELKQKSRKEALLDTQTLQSQDHSRQSALQDYILSIGEESWASKNPRIKALLIQKTKSFESRRASPKKVDTHSRIGFSGHSYDQVDLAGSNDICRFDVTGSRLSLSNRN